MQGSGVNQGQKNLPFSNIQQYEFFDDFENITNWTLANSAGAGTVATSDNNSVVYLNTGTTLNNLVSISRMYGNTNSQGNITLQNTLNFKCRFRVNSLTGCNIGIGFGHRNVTVNGLFNSGIYFNFSVSISANIRLICSNNGVNTIITTSIPLVSNTFFVCEAQANTSFVTFFINGENQGTINTNLPTLPITPSFAGLNGNAGTSYILQPDYWYHRQTFNSNRG